MDGCENEVLLYEFKADLNTYLKALGPEAPVHSLAELIAFNHARRPREMAFFGQELLLPAQKKGPLTTPAYRAALTKCRALARAQGIDAGDAAIQARRARRANRWAGVDRRIS